MKGRRAGSELQHEVEWFYYEEAACLDQGRLRDWLDLFTEDVRYWMPIREVLQEHTDGLHPESRAVSFIDDDKSFLIKRVERIETGLAHAQTPPSRTRHLITNIRITDADERELAVSSNFVLYQSRLASTEHVFYGTRDDRLRREDGELKITRRKILLDVTVLPRTIIALF